MPDLPVELVEKILGSDGLDRETLASATLLCKDVRLIAQRLLFHTLRLTFFANTDLALARLSNLIAPPRLISYARVLTITFSLGDHGWLEWAQTHNALLTATLELVEKQAENIQSLEIINGTGTVFGSHKDLAIAKRVVACMETLVRSPSLRDLLLRSASVDLLRYCTPSLKHLDVNFEYEVQPQDVRTVWDMVGRTVPIRLESLESHWSLAVPPERLSLHNYLLDPRCLIDLSSLKRLVMEIIRPSIWKEDEALLGRCSQSVEILDIRCFRA
jgi:F-box-like